MKYLLSFIAGIIVGTWIMVKPKPRPKKREHKDNDHGAIPWVADATELLKPNKKNVLTQDMVDEIFVPSDGILTHSTISLIDSLLKERKNELEREERKSHQTHPSSYDSSGDIDWEKLDWRNYYSAGDKVNYFVNKDVEILGSWDRVLTNDEIKRVRSAGADGIRASFEDTQPIKITK